MTRSPLVLLLIAVTGLTALAPIAHAGDHERHRYKSSYRDFDGGFHSQYGYEERHEQCTRHYNGEWYSRTCYDMEPTDNVYVEEDIVGDGHSRVRVFSAQDDTSPFIEYYVYNQTVERRDYYRNGWYYGSTYEVETYRTEEWAINWDSGWGKILGGFEVGVVGADVLANSGNNTAGQVVGIGLLASASASSISGAQQLHDETELKKAIAAQAAADKSGATDVK